MRTLIPWRRTNRMFMEPFREEMSELFQRFFGEAAEEGGVVQAWTPRVDVEETDKEFVIKADVPGVDPKDVDVSVNDGSLVFKGEKKEEKEEKKKNYHRVERFVGQFYRALPLPPGVDPNKISASSAKGVITVTIPKAAEAQPKKVTVKAQD